MNRKYISVCVCAAMVLAASILPAGEPAWYKGNTHAHTVLCGHADSTAEAVAAWYHAHGYNFLCLSEHNKFIDPASVTMPADKRPNFILIPGQEITGKIHTTALNAMRLVRFDFKSANTSEVIQNHVDGTIEAKGAPILNHPNFQWAVKPQDILEIKRLHLFELFNGHPMVNNAGDDARPSTERIWDHLLSHGMTVYGVSSDDMHNLKKWGQKLSNPGRGWVMVRASELTPEAITQSMLRGEFYSSSGVVLKHISKSGKTYRVEIDESATQKELDSPLLCPTRLAEGSEGYRIELIGNEGKAIETVNAASAAFELKTTDSYFRCKITASRKSGDSFIEAHAWTQPLFMDGRLKQLEKE